MKLLICNLKVLSSNFASSKFQKFYKNEKVFHINHRLHGDSASNDSAGLR